MLAALTLAVLVYGPADVAPGVRDHVIEALHRRGVTVVERTVSSAQEARAAGWRELPELSFFGAGMRLAEGARRAREQVELEAALAGYTAALAEYAPHLCMAGVRALAAEVGLERGTVLVELGRAAEARQAFQVALDLDAELTLTERHARPDVVRLFREVARAPRGPDGKAPACLEADPVIERLSALASGPAPDAVRALFAALPVDGVLVLAVGADATRALAMRAERAQTSEAEPFALDRVDESLGALLSRPLQPSSHALELDDPRLRPPPIVAPLAVRAVAKPSRKRVWPWIVAGVAAVGATVLGVTIGVVASDARYSVKVSASGFGP